MDSLNIPIGAVPWILGHECRITTETCLNSISDREKTTINIFEGVYKKSLRIPTKKERGY